MARGDPVFDEGVQLARTKDNFIGVGFRRDECSIVVDLVAFAARNLKVVGQSLPTRTQAQRESVEGGLVMTARLGIVAITRTCDCHFGKPQRNAVSSCEATNSAIVDSNSGAPPNSIPRARILAVTIWCRGAVGSPTARYN